MEYPLPDSKLAHFSDVVSHLPHRNVTGTTGSFKSSGSEPENINLMNSANKSSPTNAAGPIIAGNCISCMGMVRISHSMSVNATVRCPHCQESFVLRDLLDQSLPPLEVVVNEQAANDSESEDAPYIDTLHLKRDENANRPEKPRVKFQIPKALRDGAKKKRRRRRSRSSSGDKRSSSRSNSNFVIPSNSSVDAAATKSDSTTMGEAVERQRSSRSSSQRSSDGSRRSSTSRGGDSSSYRGKVTTHATRMKEAKVEIDVMAIARGFIGCIIAISVGYLMLIWVLKMDPLGVAPAISKTAPFVIPSSMQGGEKPEVVVEDKSKPELPSYLADDEGIKPFEPESSFGDGGRIAVPDIDPDEVFGQEFGL